MKKPVAIFIYLVITLLCSQWLTGQEPKNHLERLHFQVQVDAPPSVVFSAITEQKHFQEWSSVFSPTSRYEGEWKEGTTIRFLSTYEDGSTWGMVSRIKEIQPNKYISIEHLGMIQNGQEIMEGSEAQALKGAMENYTLVEKDGGTELQVDTDSFLEYKEYFLDTWPKALEVLKKISEKKSDK